MRISKNASRLLSLLLVAMMLIGMLPTAAFAAEAETFQKATAIEDGKEYLIVANDNGNYYALTNNSSAQTTTISASSVSGDSITLPENTDSSKILWTASAVSGESGMWNFTNGTSVLGRVGSENDTVTFGTSSDASTRRYKMVFYKNTLGNETTSSGTQYLTYGSYNGQTRFYYAFENNVTNWNVTVYVKTAASEGGNNQGGGNQGGNQGGNEGGSGNQGGNEGGNQGGSETTSQPSKVSSLTSGSTYIIAVGNKALTTGEHDGYTNSSNYSYSGYNGANITVSNGKITAGADNAAKFVVEAVSGGYTIKLAGSNNYLSATYGSNNIGGSTGTLFLSTSADTWTWGSDGLLKSKNSSKHLVFDDQANHQNGNDTSINSGNGNADLFTVRSTGEAVDFYLVTAGSGNQGGNEGGSGNQGGNEGGNQGGNQGGNEGGNQGGNEGGNQGGSDVTGNPTKVTKLENGSYIIVSGTKALTTSVHNGYTNTNSYSYKGFNGADVTISGNEITRGATSDMVFEIKSVSGGYTIKHVASGKYLSASYTQNSGNSGYTGTLTLANSADDTWVLDSNFRLKSTKASNNTKGSTLYLTFDDKPDTISTGSANLFGIRSDSNSFTNVDKLDFYLVGGEIEDDNNQGGNEGGNQGGNQGGNEGGNQGGNGNGQTVYLAFTSDVHSKTTSKTESGQSPARLNSWLTNVSSKIGAKFENMVFCGDNADGTGASNGDDFWAKVQTVMDVAAENTSLATDGLFLAGNHEWENGKLGNQSQLSASSKETAAKIREVGEVISTSNYVLYLFGASSDSQSNNGFKTEDITDLDNYLKSAPTDRPIFITSHFPIHTYGSRSTKNASTLIDTLNKYGDKLDLYFIWGHNHSQSDSNYDKFFDEDDALLNKSIKFVYCAAGAMSDSEYQGSGSVKGKGLVAKIVSGKVESLSYYGTSYTVTSSYTPSNGGSQGGGNEGGNQGGTVTPENPGLVTKLEDGNYVIVSNNNTMALTSKAHNGYTNTNGYSYTGYEGASVTISNNTVTNATSDMVFEVKSVSGGYTIKHVASGKYLNATYVSNGTGYTGTLVLSNTADDVWSWDSSNGRLKSADASENERGLDLFLTYDDKPDTVDTGSANFFGIRSEGSSSDYANVDKIDFYKVENTVDPEGPDHEHEYTAQVIDPTCTEVGYTRHTCACGDFYDDTEVDPLGHDWDDGVITKEPSKDAPGVRTYTCERCDVTKTEEIPYGPDKVYRIAGEDRIKTAIATADVLKETLGLNAFNAIIIANGDNFADALVGSYLATVKKAPILLRTTSGAGDALNEDYIDKNLVKGGTVYILGGTAVVSASVEDSLKATGYKVVRLAGKDRYETGLAILKEAGVSDSDEILIATGGNFADCLSASATGKPILTVNEKTSKLTDAQIEFLKAHSKNQYAIIGGTAAISQTLEDAIDAIVEKEIIRVYGENREATSVRVAKRYFDDPSCALIAFSGNFPDGLCGGPLAYALGAPLLLTSAGQETVTANYISNNDITRGYVLGGSAAVSDATARNVFGLAANSAIPAA